MTDYSEKFKDVMIYMKGSVNQATTQKELREFFDAANGNKNPQSQGYLSRRFINKITESKAAYIWLQEQNQGVREYTYKDKKGIRKSTYRDSKGRFYKDPFRN